MPLALTQHTPQFATAPQLLPEDFAAVRAAGFVTVINNRPDGEGGPQQPLSAEMAKAAQAEGLSYHYLPVISGAMTAQNVADMQALLTQVSGPVLAFCRSGTRSSLLWAQAQ